MIAFVLVGTN